VAISGAVIVWGGIEKTLAGSNADAEHRAHKRIENGIHGLVWMFAASVIVGRSRRWPSHTPDQHAVAVDQEMAASLSLKTHAAHLIAIERFRPRPVPRAVLVPVVLGLIGLALWLAGHLGASATPAQAPAVPAPSLTNTAGQGGGIPFIGDPIHDLTLWYSNMIHDACNADIDNLKGTFLTPLDPMSDQTVTHLYGQILLITIPLITLGGMILGYLIMVSRTRANRPTPSGR